MAKPTYRKKKLFPLYAAEDASRVSPILDALKAYGFPIANEGETPNKCGVMLLFLSEKLQDDSALSETFFRFDAEGVDVVPVSLDGSTPPELLKNALYSRNIIYAERYSFDELTNRIATAKPFEGKKNPLPIILAAAAAVLVIAGGIFLAIKLLPKPADDAAAETTPAPTAIPPIPEIPGVDPLTVAEVVYVGDEFRYYLWDEGYTEDDTDDGKKDSAIAQRNWDGGAHFYSKEDGHEIPFAVLSDLSYLSYLVNLKHLTIADAKCEIPDLSALSKLCSVTLADCEIPDLSGLMGSGVRSFEYHGSSVPDFSPLSDCAELTAAHLDLVNTETADFSGFHPPKLSDLSIANAQNLRSPDFSWLNQCTALTRLQLSDTPTLNDLSCVSGCVFLERLYLGSLNLRRLDGIETLKNLKVFSMVDVSELRDISAIAGCESLEVFQMAGYPESVYVNDLSALGKLPHLYYLSNLATGNTDLNYLKELPTKNGIRFIFASTAVTDYSGLGAIESYDFIYMNLWGDNDGALDAAPALEYLKEPAIDSFYFRNARNVDLSMLSHVQSYLGLEHCDVSDFTTLSDNAAFGQLEIDDCRNLQSLDGIEKIAGFGKKETGTTGGGLFIQNCPHLVDWSALEGMQLSELYLIELSTLPDFSTFTAKTYYLEKFPELTDLKCFEGLDPDLSCNICLIDLPNLTDIGTLYKLKGRELRIGPEWKEQAEELVRLGNFESCEIVYPDGSWQPNDGEIMLLSLDELDTLPPSVLKRVKRLDLIGDVPFDPDAYHVEQDDSADPPKPVLCANDGSERIEVDPGSTVDFSKLAALTGLEELRLYGQTFATLEGIQNMQNLRTLAVSYSPALTDVSAAFTLQGLERLELTFTGVTSMQGVQNLTRLEALGLLFVPVTDLSPVLKLPNLQSLTVSADMEEAIASLGDGVGFALNVEE